MPSSQALRLCPDLQFISPNFAHYREVSGQMREIFARYTDLIEPLSLDEAYLDVSDSEHHQGSATLIARAIKQSVRQEVGITVSAGVAPNKFLAKVASDWEKPDGLFVIEPAQVLSFVEKLPVNKINGVGKVTYKKLQDLGIETCGDIAESKPELILSKFGKHGARLIQLAQGIDDRRVTTDRIRKSISVEHTYDIDLPNPKTINEKLPKIYGELKERLEKYEARVPGASKRIHKYFVKLKFNDFTQTTLEHTLQMQETWDNIPAIIQMLEEAWDRQAKPVRLIGLGLRFKTPEFSGGGLQLDLFEDREVRKI